MLNLNVECWRPRLYRFCRLGAVYRCCRLGAVSSKYIAQHLQGVLVIRVGRPHASQHRGANQFGWVPRVERTKSTLHNLLRNDVCVDERMRAFARKRDRERSLALRWRPKGGGLAYAWARSPAAFITPRQVRATASKIL